MSSHSPLPPPAPVELKTRELYWIPHPSRTWTTVMIQEIYNDHCWVHCVEDGSEFELDINFDDYKFYPVNTRCVDDMTSLHFLHEPGILRNLEERSQPVNQRPYTYVANVLVAVNPLRRIPDPPIAVFKDTPISSNDPHPYGIAELAYKQMTLPRSLNRNQSIVISGESGAGKTETAKIVLRYLCWRASNTASGLNTASSSLDRKLLESNPILEAFGNAKTHRNNNSSRFGKFMKLQFNAEDKFKLTAAGIETYLLEKSRVVTVADEERNYHVFYQLLAGATQKQVKLWRLHEVGRYEYLNKSSCYEVEDMNDAANFEKLSQALREIGLSAMEHDVLFRIISSILHLGNVFFYGVDAQGGEAAKVQNAHTLDLAAEMLGVEASALDDLLTMRELVTVGAGRRGSRYQIHRDPTQANYARDAVSKALYSQIFDWLVNRIGRSLNQGPDSLPFIGVLDIFGFESFHENSLEQLLINYSNETLQQSFNRAVLEAEQRLYREEGLQVQEIVFSSNSECVELIAGVNGIFSILDATCKAPNPSEEKFITQLHMQRKGHPYFPRPHPKDMRHTFLIKHYAQEVKYTIGSFIHKNMDVLPPELSVVLAGSSHTAKCDVFTFNDHVEEEETHCAPDTETTVGTGPLAAMQMMKALKQGQSVVPKQDSGARKKGRKAQLTVTQKFAKQMQSLCDLLDRTTSSFIRCIKPNGSMTPAVFDHSYVVAQLRSLGIVQTCEVLKVGMPTRIAFAALEDMYRVRLPPNASFLLRGQGAEGFTESLMWAFNIPKDAYQMGTSKIFFKTGKIALLDAVLKVDMEGESGDWLTKRLTRWVVRRWWRAGVSKVIAQDKFTKLFIYVRSRRRAATKLQAIWRMFIQSGRYKKRKALRKRWRVAMRKVLCQKILLEDYLLMKEATEMRLKAEKEAEEQAKREEEAAKIRVDDSTDATREGLVAAAEASNELRAVAAVSVLATVSMCIFRWQKVKYFAAFETWLGAIDTSVEKRRWKDRAMLLPLEELEPELDEDCYECEDRKASMWCKLCDHTYCRVCCAFVHNSCKFMREHEPIHISLRPPKDDKQDTLSSIVEDDSERDSMSISSMSSQASVMYDSPASMLAPRSSNTIKRPGNMPVLDKKPDTFPSSSPQGSRKSFLRSRTSSADPELVRFTRTQSGNDSTDTRDVHQRNRSLFEKLVAETSSNDGLNLSRVRSFSTAPARRGTVHNATLQRGRRDSIMISVGAPRTGGEEECAIKSCKKGATKGVTIRFCDAHYEEFRNHMRAHNEENDEQKTLQNQVALLKRQLAAAGQQAVEFVELHVARQKMQEAVQKLMSGDESAEKEIERWDQAIRMNPDYQKEMDEKAKRWEEEQRPYNEECVRRMRSLIPPEIMKSDFESLLETGVPKAVATRLWSKKALWLIRMHPEDTKKVHIADLRSKYGNQGLDIVEMRAIWMCIPKEFDNDGDGKKAEWLVNFRQKLEELTTKEASNRLSKQELRHPAYKGCEDVQLFDPEAELVRANALKSTAFAPTEKPEEAIKKSKSENAAVVGWLDVCRPETDQWERKYCVFKDGALKCFCSEEECTAEGSMALCLSLSESSSASEMNDVPDHDHVICLRLSADDASTIYKCAAETQEIRNSWIVAFTAVIHHARRLSEAQASAFAYKKNKSRPEPEAPPAKEHKESKFKAAGHEGVDRGGLLGALNRRNGEDSGSNHEPTIAGGPMAGLMAALAKRNHGEAGEGGGGPMGGLMGAIAARAKKNEA